MSKVTIYLRTHNDQSYIEEALISLLKQRGVDFEILIVDDASEDKTLEIINSFKHKKIRVIKNNQCMGRAYCNNLIIEKSQSPFIVFTEPNYRLLHDAVMRLFDKIASADNIGLVHCYNFAAGEEGTITRESFHKIFERTRRTLSPYMNLRNEISCSGLEINGLRIYRKELFGEVGMFDEKIKRHDNYDLSLRILDKFEIELLPQFLFYVKKKNSFMHFSQLRSIYDLPNKLAVSRNLVNSGKDLNLSQKHYKPYKIVLNSLYNALPLRKAVEILDNVFMKVLTYVNEELFIPLFSKIYNLLVSYFSRWHIDLFLHKNDKHGNGNKRIAYFIWQFPVMSQTFIQREVATLMNAGYSVQVISQIEAEDDLLEEYTSALHNTIVYLSSIDKKRLAIYKRYFFFKNPLIYLSLFFYVICHEYHGIKSFKNDRKKFSKAISLAGVLKEYNINHIHSPWADNCAFVSLIASRLLGISYSLQARAHDIHRKTYLVGLEERFTDAEFIVTNTQYNVSRINSLLNHHRHSKVYLIYNGINLDKIRPHQKRKKLQNPFKILSVARLIEQKGLVYLLKACKILKDKGYKFECEIIGGREGIFANYYLELKKLHVKLELTNYVYFLGPQPFGKVLEGYRKADLFVLPCVIAEDGSQDITPNSLIEAMAMKLPVISTTVTGIPEIVEDGVSGTLVPPNDENALAEAMRELIENENLRKQMARNARKRVEEKFDIEKNVLNYVMLFDQQ